MAGVKGGGSRRKDTRRSRTTTAGSAAFVSGDAGGGGGAPVVNVRGTRSKVQIFSQESIPRRQDGLEDEDALFAAAKSPPVVPETTQKNSSSSSSSDDDEMQEEDEKVVKKGKKKNEQSPPPPQKSTVRFSLETQDQGDEASSNGPSSRFIEKMKSSRQSMSPSELSIVSTAPPSTRVSNDDDDNVDDDDDDNDISNTPVHGKHDMDEEEEEKKTEDEQTTPMDVTPPGVQPGSEDSQPISSSVKDRPQAQDEEDDEDDGFPVPVDDNDDDESHGNLEDEHQDDDLIPPPPPDSPERDSEPLDKEEEAEVPTQDGALSNEEEESPGVPKDDESQNYDDDDKEGSGFEMADPKTPASSIRTGRFSGKGAESTVKRKRASEKKPEETQKKKKKRKKDEDDKKKKKKRKKGAVSSEESDEDDPSTVVPKKKKKKSTSRFATRFSPKGIPLALEYETIPLSDLKPDDEGTPPEGLRRSRRTRVPPLAFWKNEKPEYGANDDEEAPSDLINMPVVKAYIRALDTPYKPRRVPPATQQRGKQKGKTATSSSSSNRLEAVQSEPFDSSRLRAKLDVIDGEEGRLWDDNIEEATHMKVVAYKSRMEARKLPLVKNRSKAEGKVVGKAAQAFNVHNGVKEGYAGYIMGNLTLPPKGIKDAESVGSCSQTFTVVTGQPGALEIAYADPDEDENGNLSPETALRYLLGPGDMFRVPPGNCYRLQNHSKTESCFLTWTIIRPVTLDNHQGGSPGSSQATSVGGQSSKN